MIDPINWLHISDIHIKEDQAWQQDVVLKAMCADIAQKRSNGLSLSFILVSGDLTFSGNKKEYSLAIDFFDALSKASGVIKEMIFCIPGNHDIQRGRQKFCFIGARQTLQSQNHIDFFFSSKEDVETLLIRLTNFHDFQKSYFSGQTRTATDFEMAYVSVINIGEIRMAIIGLNSSWLSEGGIGDHGKLLIGERQVIDAISLAEMKHPHFIIAMAHHPFHLLQDFDRRPVENRVERSCHFFHCGHLHEPEAHVVSRNGSHCVTLAAGASFETRHTQNSYSIISLDILKAKSTVETIQYNPREGVFSTPTLLTFPHDISSSELCSIIELAKVIQQHNKLLAPISHYLAALLLNAKSEFIIPNGDEYVFGSFAVLEAQPDSHIKKSTATFFEFQNVIKIFNKKKTPGEILTLYGTAVSQYGTMVMELCEQNATLREKINEREKDAIKLTTAQPNETFHYTNSLLKEFADNQEWIQLQRLATRHINSTDQILSKLARRMLALSLAHSGEVKGQICAIDQFQSLIDSKEATAEDIGTLVTLFINSGRNDEAKALLLYGIQTFPIYKSSFYLLGQKVIEATGDKDFRQKLNEEIK